jgi:general secretion pathway protein D
MIICLSTAVQAARIDESSPSRPQAAAKEIPSATDAEGKVIVEAPKVAAPLQAPAGMPQIGGADNIQAGKSDAAMPAGAEDSILIKPDEPASARKKQTEAVARKSAEKYVTLDFDNVNIEVFVKFISELTGKNFIIDDKVKGKVTIYSPKKIPLRDVYKVFLSVLELNGFATVPVGDMIKIVPSAIAREKSVETRTKKDGTDADDRIVTQIISLERANPDEVKRVLDPIISKTSSVLSYPPAGVLIITDYLSNIRRLQEIVRALDVEGAGEQITYLPLQNASASEVVKSLTVVFQQRRATLTPIRMVADPRTNSLIIFASVSDTENVRKLIAMMDKEAPRGESNIQVYRLQNAVADDLSKVLNSIIKETGGATAGAAGAAGAAAPRIAAPVVSKNVQIVPDKATNTLVIMAEREDYKVLESIIKQLDVPRAMVYIEALIMEVNATKDFKLGVEWSALKDTGSVQGIPNSGSAAFVSSGTGVLSSLATSTAGVLGFPSGFSMGIIGAGIKIGGVMFPTIGAMVQAYKHDSDVSILSTPQLLTLDNEEAEINVGSNVPYLTRQDSTASTTTNAVNYNTYEYKDVGVILNITPHINEENFVRLKISQQVTKVTSGADKATPTTLKRTAKTTVVVKDSETIVIGGLVGDSTDDGTTRVPLLGDIPLLGWLFKAKTVKREKTNLYVFLTPHIVRTQQEAASLYQSKRETMGDVEEGIIKLNERKQESYPSQTATPEDKKAPAKP